MGPEQGRSSYQKWVIHFRIIMGSATLCLNEAKPIRRMLNNFKDLRICHVKFSCKQTNKNLSQLKWKIFNELLLKIKWNFGDFICCLKWLWLYMRMKRRERNWNSSFLDNSSLFYLVKFITIFLLLCISLTSVCYDLILYYFKLAIA